MADQNPFHTAPNCVSQGAFEYMGFTTAIAKDLWRQSVELASEFQCSFEEFAFIAHG